MLKKDRISKIKIFSDEWQVARMGKFTSSKISSLMAKSENSDGFMTYVYQKVGEELTGKPVYDDMPPTDAMQWGLEYEPVAIRKFGEIKKLDFLIVQQLIIVPNSRFMSTPDALMVMNESTDETAYNVATVEVKCFPTYTNYITLALCKKPSDVKKEFAYVYWQVLDQMDNCDCLTGYLVCYHPLFKAGNLSIIEFKKIELYEDIKFLKHRKQKAVEKFEEVRAELIAIGNLT